MTLNQLLELIYGPEEIHFFILNSHVDYVLECRFYLAPFEEPFDNNEYEDFVRNFGINLVDHFRAIADSSYEITIRNE